MSYYTHYNNDRALATTTEVVNRVCAFKDKLYCWVDGEIYQHEGLESSDWSWQKVDLAGLPDQIEVRTNGEMRLRPAPTLSQECFCEMAALMRNGCNCGGH